MMYLKIHETRDGKIVAACDADLIGKIIEDEKHHLDLKASKEFYVGNLCDEKGLENALKNFYSANLVGKNTVNVAIKCGFAHENDVIYINKIPHIQIYRI